MKISWTLFLASSVSESNLIKSYLLFWVGNDIKLFFTKINSGFLMRLIYAASDPFKCFSFA